MRRNILNIYAAILEVCSNIPVMTTHVMYKANINCTAMNQEYFPTLIESGLLQNFKVPDKKHFHMTYQTTDKGKKWLAQYYDLLERVGMKEKRLWWRNDAQ